PAIKTTIQLINSEYIDAPQGLFGRNLKASIHQTTPFNNSIINYNNHVLVYSDEDYDDLLSNIYEYASMVIYEINVRFPDYPLVTAMKALNPSEWPSIESEDFITFGLSELKILVDVFGVKKSTDVNGYNEISPLIDQNECQNEYPGFKTIVATNYFETIA
ncbi:15906_t:CDS:1, partial [Entrophospora sp. SA101]